MLCCSLYVKCHVEAEISQLLLASPMLSQQSAYKNSHLQLSCACNICEILLGLDLGFAPLIETEETSADGVNDSSEANAFRLQAQNGN